MNRQLCTCGSGSGESLLPVGSAEAARLIKTEGVTERVQSLVATTDSPAAAAGGGTAALLHNTCLINYAGFAMTAKPSVNLLLLLQVCSHHAAHTVHLTPCSSHRAPHTMHLPQAKQQIFSVLDESICPLSASQAQNTDGCEKVEGCCLHLDQLLLMCC